jgi:tetratricopeptide (TPR) repeat protein
MGYIAGEDVYAPCSCGSGKKYKFCCLPKHREERKHEKRVLPRLWRPELEPELEREIFDLDAGKEAHELGLKLLGRGELDAAAAQFRRAIEIVPLFPAPYNNLAMALFGMGHVEQAIQVVEHVDRNLDPANAFTLGCLVHFYLLVGRDEDARSALNRLVKQAPRDEFATLKKCEALARVRDHSRVLDTALSMPRAEELGAEIAYFAGTALANLGRLDEAAPQLEAARSCPNYGERAACYLKLVRRREVPQSVDGDWPYLEPGTWVSNALLRRIEGGEDFRRWPGVVEVLVAFVNEEPIHAARFVKLLGSFGTSRSLDVLRKLAYGTFGTDESRAAAATEIEHAGASPAESEVLVLGKWQKLRTIAVSGEALSKLPDGVVEPMQELVAALRSDDLTRAEELGRQLLAQAPDCSAVCHNLAMALLGLGKRSEAEQLLERAIALDPSYLFAPAVLAQQRLLDGRIDEAREILRRVELPATPIHSDAYACFLQAQLFVATHEGDIQTVAYAIRMLREVAPDRLPKDRERADDVVRFAEAYSSHRELLRQEEARLRRRVLPLSAGVIECLHHFDSERVKSIARSLQVEPTGSRSRRALVEAILRTLGDAAEVRRIVATLAATAQSALAELVEAGGSLPYIEFTRKYGTDDVRTTRSELEKEESVLRVLKAHGLVVEGTRNGIECVIVPAEVAKAVRDGETF